MKVVCLAGGVGGAKLAEGLAQLLLPESLTIIGNTGDDFWHLGLPICPDLDTVMYTLAGVANVETGWGRSEESWRTIDAVAQLGGPDWFRLGDLDLATHLTRGYLLGGGWSLTAVTRHLCQQLNVPHKMLPMSDQPAPTQIVTADGRTLPFQTWFVRERWQPAVAEVKLPVDARATPQVMSSLEQADLVVIAPSNPFVSVDPILNVYPIRAMLEDIPQAVVAVSPIIGGQAVKGPAAKMMREMGLNVSATAVANYYGELLDGFIYDTQDAGELAGAALATLCIDTLMKTPADRKRVAEEVLNFAQELIS